MLAPKVEQDLDLSLDSQSAIMNASQVKLFSRYAESMLCFLDQGARNVTILFNQQELCDNVISASVLKDIGLGAADAKIQDFSIVGFQFLVILVKQSNLVVFDVEQVLSGRDRQVRYMMTIALELSQIAPAGERI